MVIYRIILASGKRMETMQIMQQHTLIMHHDLHDDSLVISGGP